MSVSRGMGIGDGGERVNIFLGQDLKSNLPVIHKQRYERRKSGICVCKGNGRTLGVGVEGKS